MKKVDDTKWIRKAYYIVYILQVGVSIVIISVENIKNQSTTVNYTYLLISDYIQ